MTMTDDENLAYETMRAALAAEERTTARLKASLKVAQGDEVHWREYYIEALEMEARVLAAGNTPNMEPEQAANQMLAIHKQRWRD